MASKAVTCADIDGNTYEVGVDNLYWRPAAYGIVIKDGCILLSPQLDGYDLPGGGLDLGETPEAAAVREVKEETGIDIANLRLVTCKTSFFKFERASEQGAQSLQFYLLCDYAGGELSIDGLEDYEKAYTKMPEWLPILELDDIKVKSLLDWRPIVKESVHL